ncbi:MAG: DUF2703 domain-containing protein [Kiloniellales bacterium]
MTGDTASKTLDIDFLYLDLSICSRCRDTDAILDEAVSEVAPVLESKGVGVCVKKTQVQSEEQARELGFVSSPTIRIAGRDIQPDVKESRCEACSGLCDECINCREWTYHGKVYTIPPKAMVVEAIIREVYGGPTEGAQRRPEAEEVPDNLKRFFASTRRKSA